MGSWLEVKGCYPWGGCVCSHVRLQASTREQIGPTDRPHCSSLASDQRSVVLLGWGGGQWSQPDMTTVLLAASDPGSAFRGGLYWVRSFSFFFLSFALFLLPETFLTQRWFNPNMWSPGTSIPPPVGPTCVLSITAQHWLSLAGRSVTPAACEKTQLSPHNHCNPKKCHLHHTSKAVHNSHSPSVWTSFWSWSLWWSCRFVNLLTGRLWFYTRHIYHVVDV